MALHPGFRPECLLTCHSSDHNAPSVSSDIEAVANDARPNRSRRWRPSSLHMFVQFPIKTSLPFHFSFKLSLHLLSLVNTLPSVLSLIRSFISISPFC
jgi:hypothetical protein